MELENTITEDIIAQSSLVPSSNMSENGVGGKRNAIRSLSIKTKCSVKLNRLVSTFGP